MQSDWLCFSPTFFLGVLPYAPSARAWSLPQEDTARGSSKTRPNCSSWQLDFLYIHTHGVNIIKTTPGYSRKLSIPWLSSRVWGLWKGEKCVNWQRSTSWFWWIWETCLVLWRKPLSEKNPWFLVAESIQGLAVLPKRLDPWPNQSVI